MIKVNGDEGPRELNAHDPGDLAKLLSVKAQELGKLQQIIAKRVVTTGQPELTPTESSHVMLTCLDALAWTMHTLSLVARGTANQRRVAPVYAMPPIRPPKVRG